MKKQRKFLRVWGAPLPTAPRPPPPPPTPRKILKVETKICAIWGILEANSKKCSTLKFMTNISFVPSICTQRSIILIFTEKKVCLSIFFPTENTFFRNFWFSFPRESSFPRRIPRSTSLCLSAYPFPSLPRGYIQENQSLQANSTMGMKITSSSSLAAKTVPKEKQKVFCVKYTFVFIRAPHYVTAYVLLTFIFFRIHW